VGRVDGAVVGSDEGCDVGTNDGADEGDKVGALLGACVVSVLVGGTVVVVRVGQVPHTPGHKSLRLRENDPATTIVPQRLVNPPQPTGSGLPPLQPCVGAAVGLAVVGAAVGAAVGHVPHTLGHRSLTLTEVAPARTTVPQRLANPPQPTGSGMPLQPCVGTAVGAAVRLGCAVGVAEVTSVAVVADVTSVAVVETEVTVVTVVGSAVVVVDMGVVSAIVVDGAMLVTVVGSTDVVLDVGVVVDVTLEVEVGSGCVVSGVSAVLESPES
jgi:hypothetical protein